VTVTWQHDPIYTSFWSKDGATIWLFINVNQDSTPINASTKCGNDWIKTFQAESRDANFEEFRQRKKHTWRDMEGNWTWLRYEATLWLSMTKTQQLWMQLTVGIPAYIPHSLVVLLRYSKPTPIPRFFAKTARRQNLGFFCHNWWFLASSAC